LPCTWRSGRRRVACRDGLPTEQEVIEVAIRDSGADDLERYAAPDVVDLCA
jgi:hypothetical protein